MIASYHQPVMGAACVEALAIQPNGVYVDATFGGGGHSRLILQALGASGRLFGFDQDPDAAANVPQDARFVLVSHNFRHLRRMLRLHGVQAVDGVLADLGVSSHQLDSPERGFSYRFDSALDMRMNPAEERSAAMVLNTYTAAQLQQVFSAFGEVRNARTLAEQIVQVRQGMPLQTVGDFIAIMEPLIRGNRLRYLSQVFQALRMEVNDEMGALAEMLSQALEVLKPGGRLVVLTYHSVEDRMVKRFLKTGNPEGEVAQDFYGHIRRPFELPKGYPAQPSEAEISRNPRARSARLRLGIKR